MQCNASIRAAVAVRPTGPVPEFTMISSRRYPVSAPLVAWTALTIACVGPAQTVTVGPAGSGAMFTSIQEGIDAAPPGGVVLVAAGSYAAAATLTIDKPLTLLGAGSATTTYTAQGPGFPSGMLLPEQMQVARSLMARYSQTLRELAK